MTPVSAILNMKKSLLFPAGKLLSLDCIAWNPCIRSEQLDQKTTNINRTFSLCSDIHWQINQYHLGHHDIWGIMLSFCTLIHASFDVRQNRICVLKSFSNNLDVSGRIKQPRTGHVPEQWNVFISLVNDEHSPEDKSWLFQAVLYVALQLNRRSGSHVFFLLAFHRYRRN